MKFQVFFLDSKQEINKNGHFKCQNHSFKTMHKKYVFCAVGIFFHHETLKAESVACFNSWKIKIYSAFFVYITQLLAEHWNVHSHGTSVNETMDLSGHLKSQILTKVMTKNYKSPKKSIDLLPNSICEKVSSCKKAWCQNYEGSKLRV